MKLFLVVFLCLFVSINFLNGQTVIKLQRENGVYIIPCKVNGIALRFIFDTGSSNVSISLSEAVFMYKNGYLKNEDFKGTEYYQIADGNIKEGTVINIKEIEFEGFILQNVEASVVHNLSAPLLLGQSAISKLGTIQLNPNNSTLTIMKGNYSNSNSNYYTSNNESTSKNKSSSNKSEELSGDKYYKSLPIYKGTVSVFTYSPILETPDMVSAKQIGFAENNKVEIIKQVNEKYYQVNTGNTTGFLWVGWIK